MEKIARSLLSMRMMAIAMIVFLVAIGWATILESNHDIQTAKILIYNAVIKTKVMYGLETAEPKLAGLMKLHAFQLKGLRRILNIVTTFVDRNNMNTWVLQKGDEGVNSGLQGAEKGSQSNC